MIFDFGSATNCSVMVSTKSQKDAVILGRCAVIDAATAVFRFNHRALDPNRDTSSPVSA